MREATHSGVVAARAMGALSPRARLEASVTGPGAGLEGSIFGPWRLQRQIGESGLGEVYLAEATSSSAALGGASPDSSLSGVPGARQAAIKIMRPPASDSLTRDVVAGAERARALRAPHVIPLYGAIQQGNHAGVAMAWVPGGSLAEALARRGANGQPTIPLPMRPAVVARLITQVGRALASAHTAGLAHGDVKPSNIFIRQSSRGGLIAALSDFGQGGVVGLAVQVIISSSPVAREPWVQERLLFTAPERLAGAPPDPASDQYSLAAVAYYLLTGRAPVTGDAATLLATIPSASVMEPSALLPTAPEGLDAILLRALAKDPMQRFESVEAFVRTLDQSLASAKGVTRVTQEFSRLSGRRPSDQPGPPARRARGASSSGLPSEPPAALWRGLALATAAAALIAIITCGVGLVALNSAGVQPSSLLTSFQGPNAVATERGVEAPLSPEAVAANRQLQTIVAQAPIFKDSLATNTGHWQATGGQLSFGSGGLDLVNQSVAQPALANAPTTLSQSDYAGQVTLRFKSGEAGDLAGLRFFVTDTGSGSEEYYAFFLAPNGEYYLQYYQDTWHYLAGGYANAIKPGVDVANTLSFVTHSAHGDVTIYVNGSYIASVPLEPGGPMGGEAGLIVLNHGVDAVYSNFTLYPAPQG
jgi:serine/threonine-protein kinase